MGFSLDFETTLELFGFGCIFFVAFSTIKEFVFNFDEMTGNPAKLYKTMNRDNMIGGLGVMALLYLAIMHHSYPQIAILSLSFVYNIYRFWDRNREQKQEG
ncbi:MAG: hypothetical protein ACKVOU_08540 [Cytophagales bacterium]